MPIPSGHKCYSKILVTTYKTTQHHNPDHNGHIHCHNNLKSLILTDCFNFYMKVKLSLYLSMSPLSGHIHTLAVFCEGDLQHHWMGGWVNTRATQGVEENRKILLLSGIKPWSFSLSFNWLGYLTYCDFDILQVSYRICFYIWKENYDEKPMFHDIFREKKIVPRAKNIFPSVLPYKSKKHIICE